MHSRRAWPSTATWPYVSRGHPRQVPDLYLPYAAGPLPLIVRIHGSAFRMGSTVAIGGHGRFDDPRIGPLVQTFLGTHLMHAATPYDGAST